MTIFKAYDVRGVYGTELSEAEATTIGRAYGTSLAGGTATVGRDTRTSGPALEAAFLDGVLSTGARVEEYRRPPDRRDQFRDLAGSARRVGLHLRVAQPAPSTTGSVSAPGTDTASSTRKAR